MTVQEYYYKHFDELSSEKKFHFATRIKNYFKIDDFNDFLKNNVLDKNIKPILMDNDYSKVGNYEMRRPFFEKYPDLYGVEAALFRTHHLLTEYNIGIREQFQTLYPVEKLYQLSDRLLNDNEALKALSTWAINAVCLIEELFPRGKNVSGELSEWLLNQNVADFNPTLFVYFCTHIILCESQFYTKNVTKSQNLDLLKSMLKKSADVIGENIDTISLDAAIEFLVCCNLVGVNYPALRNKIKKICNEYKKDSPYLINYRRDNTPGSYFHTLNGAEHINVLYIMSGLDY